MTDHLNDLPSDMDLRELLRFSNSDGRIWLAGQRMLLMHVNALQALRNEIIHTLGLAQARKLLMRAGHSAGTRDGLLARQVRSQMGTYEAYAVGPQLHMLEGAVQVKPVAFDYRPHADPLQSHFHAVFNWHHSWEAEAHRSDHGLQHESACWSLLGYACGYSSAFFQQPVLFKETQCEACGKSHCQIEGRFLHEWESGDTDTAVKKKPTTGLLWVGGAAAFQARSAHEQYMELAKTPLTGRSPAFVRAFELLRQAAPTQVSVLLTGETGVGKEQFARALHALSKRSDRPFVAINCAALPADLIESELFGVEKGAYTGALATRMGRFERADGGTLFLDELGELPLPAQAKLLRVLQQGEIERLGGTQARKIDVRIVAATNVDLTEAAQAGRFRQDLLYRLNVYPIEIPPLRERLDDIALLAKYFLEHYGRLHNKRIVGFEDAAMQALHNHPWPGNVRELGNAVERAVILAPPGQLDIPMSSLFPAMAAPLVDRISASGQLQSAATRPRSASSEHNALAPAPSPSAQVLQLLQQHGLSLEELEQQLLREAMARSQGNQAAAARLLKISRPKFTYRLGRVQHQKT